MQMTEAAGTITVPAADGPCRVCGFPTWRTDGHADFCWLSPEYMKAGE